jgi:T5orf172 domain-containing protein
MSMLDKNCEYVYSLEEVEDSPTGFVKIGSTGNSAEVRANQLQTGNARKLKPYAAIKTPIGQSLTKERELQDFFKAYQTKFDGGTEWFDDRIGHIKKILR